MSAAIKTDYPGFGARAMALAVDFALLAALYILLFVLLAGLLFNRAASLEVPGILALLAAYLILFFVCFIFLHMFYFVIFHAWSGQTIGKMLMGIRVVARDRSMVSPAAAFLRWAGYFLSLLPLGAGFLWAAVDKDHCAWHDRLAQTMVIAAEMT